MDEETKRKNEKECEESKKHETCEEFLKHVPNDQLKVEPKTEESLEDKAKKKVNFIKTWLQIISKPPKEERHEDIFKYCTTHEPPCNLECLYGHRQLEDEELDDIIKERIYTKQGAIYDTISYRLPLDFGVGPVPVTKEEKLAAEQAAQLVKQPWYDDDKTKKKKKKKKKPEMLEFSGPVRIHIVEKEGLFTCYTAKRLHAAFIQLSYMFIGATILLMYFYTIQFRTHYSTNLHIICCTIAFQFCLPAALLVRNKECVAGNLMSTKHTFQHSVMLKTIAIINIVGCAVLFSEWKPVLPVLYTTHALLGYAACSFALAEYILHLLVAYLLGHNRGFIVDCYLHFLIIAAIVTAFISFALAILNHPSIKKFVNYTHWYYWMLAMTGVFILTAIFRTCMHCLFHIWNYLYAVGMWIFHLVRPHDPCTDRIKDIENPFNLINQQVDLKRTDPKTTDRKTTDRKATDRIKTNQTADQDQLQGGKCPYARN